MNEFDREVYTRKNIAGQARHRKRGSKSKKCTLPSDRLTNKQWKERCGKIVAYNNSKPMAWKIFKQLSKVSQEEYLQGLQTKYGATAKDMAAMFGLNPVSVRRYVEDHELNVAFPRGVKQKTQEQKVAWDEFLGVTAPENEKRQEMEYEAFVPAVAHDETFPVSDFSMHEDSHAVHNSTSSVMSQFSISFQGRLDIDMIANSLRQILGNDALGKIQISYEFT